MKTEDTQGHKWAHYRSAMRRTCLARLFFVPPPEEAPASLERHHFRAGLFSWAGLLTQLGRPGFVANNMFLVGFFIFPPSSSNPSFTYRPGSKFPRMLLVGLCSEQAYHQGGRQMCSMGPRQRSLLTPSSLKGMGVAVAHRSFWNGLR